MHRPQLTDNRAAQGFFHLFAVKSLDRLQCSGQPQIVFCQKKGQLRLAKIGSSRSCDRLKRRKAWIYSIQFPYKCKFLSFCPDSTWMNISRFVPKSSATNLQIWYIWLDFWIDFDRKCNLFYSRLWYLPGSPKHYQLCKFTKDIGKISNEFIQVDRLEDELMGEQEKLKGISEELEQTFAEMSGYWSLNGLDLWKNEFSIAP